MNPRTHQVQALEILSTKTDGIIAYATGAGKTLIQILDVKRIFDESKEPKTVVVVAPRILLAAQLSYDYSKHINDVMVLHVHTKNGKLKHYHTTNPKVIKEWVEIHQAKHRLIFTTYHSLKKLYKSGVEIDTIMYDESHNSTSAGFHEYVKKIRDNTNRAFHFTASPRYSKSNKKPGMNDPIYGGIIARASAAEMIKQGHILKPRVITHQLEWISERTAQNDADDILNILKEYNISQLLVNVKSTKSMMEMLSETNFKELLKESGYDLLHITSQYGAYYNNESINRDKFFKLLDEFGKNSNKKFILLNYSILGEGINVSSLDAVLLMRQPNLIKLVQNIGRTLRLSHEDSQAIENGELTPGDYSKYCKPEGLVIIPVYNKQLLAASQEIQTTVENVYEQGEIPIMTT